MSKLVLLLIKWIVQRLAVLVLILAVLLVGVWIKSEWSKLSRTMEEIGRKERFMRSLEGELERLNGEIEKEAGPQREMLAKLASLDEAASTARDAAEMAKFRWDYWRGQVGWYQALMEQWKVAKRETAKAEYWARHGTAVAAEKARDLYAETLKDSRIYQLLKDKNEVESASRQLAQLIGEEKEAVRNDPKQRLVAAIRSQLPTALWILLGIILTPVLIKAFFYYVLAPLAQLLPPIRILPDSEAPAIPGPVPSAVSLAFEIGPDEEILVHPDFLQSSSLPARKRTQWFLNPRMPFSSIASGMFMLTRIQPEEDGTSKVMVSSQNDAFGEIGMLELPDGAAVVVQPRSLAGIIKRQGDRVFITRHWRLLEPARLAHPAAPLPGLPRSLQADLEGMPRSACRGTGSRPAAHDQPGIDDRLQRESCLQEHPLRNLHLLSSRQGGPVQRPVRRGAGPLRLRGDAGRRTKDRDHRPRPRGPC